MLLSRRAFALLAFLITTPTVHGDELADGRRLYVAAPGIRNYLEYGGHGLLVFDIDDGHRLLKRIPTAGLDAEGKPINVKGICASAATGRLHISTIGQLMCIDLRTGELLWEREFEPGCDRMALSPDGRTMYLPSFEGPTWQVVDAVEGDLIATLRPDSGAHNTLYGPDGREVYLAGLKSPLLSVADPSKHEIVRAVGPFSAPVRPFTVNNAQTRVYACVNDLLGFEVADLESGKLLHRVEVPGFEKGPIKRHGCPSHGIGLTPDEREVWVVDATNRRVHIFDNQAEPSSYLESIELKDEPGWITFSLDGAYAYPSTGDVIDVKTRQIVAELKDEQGNPVMSEKVVEVHFRDGQPVATGDQFGIGRKPSESR